MKKLFVLLSLALFVVASCDDLLIDPSPQPVPSPSPDVLTPDQQKEKLNSTGRNLIGKIDADRFEDIVNLMDYFEGKYGGLEMDEAYIDKLNEISPGVSKSLDTKAAVSGAVAAIRRAISNPLSSGGTDIVKFDAGVKDFYGTFRPNFKKNIWEYTSSSDCLELIFQNEAGKECSLRLSCSGKEQTVNVNMTDKYKGTAYVDEVTAKIPEEFLVVLKEGSSTLASLDLTFDISGTFTLLCDEDKERISITTPSSPISINTQFTVSDYKVEYEYSIAPKVMSTSVSISDNGTLLVDASVSIGGKFAPLDMTVDEYTEEQDIVEDHFSSVSASMNVMDVVQVSCSCPDISKAMDVAEELSNLEESDREAWKAAIDDINDAASVLIFYDNEDGWQARLKADRGEYYDEWDGESYYYVIPVLEFSDGTVYDMEDFFDSDYFDRLIRDFNRMVEDFEYLGE